MKNRPIIALFIALIVCLTGLSPIVSFAKGREINFGDVALKSKRDTTIYVVATYEPMWVMEAKSSCSCVKVKFNRAVVMAKDSVAIKISFSADDKGVFYKTIKVVSSDDRLNEDVIVRGRVK